MRVKYVLCFDVSTFEDELNEQIEKIEHMSCRIQGQTYRAKVFDIKFIASEKHTEALIIWEYQ